MCTKDSLCHLQTFIFANVFQSKSQAGILPLDDPHLAERTLAYDSQQAEVIEVDCLKEKGQHVCPVRTCFGLLDTGRLGGGLGAVALAGDAAGAEQEEKGNSPSSVKTTGLPLELPIGS